MFMYLKFTTWRRGWPVGLVAWFSLRVREVPGSTPGQAPFSRPYFSLFFLLLFYLFVYVFCFFFFRLASNAFPDFGSVARIEKKNWKKITRRTTLKIHNILLKHVPVFLYSVTMLIFQIKRIISGEKWVNQVVTFFLFFYFFIDDVKAILLIISV